MSQEGNTQIPGKLDQSITNSGLDNGLITGQGQEVTVTGCGDKNTSTMPPGSDEDAFQKLFRLLQAGISVNQSICNTNSKDLVIVGQGQRSHLHGVEINRNDNTQPQQTQQEQMSYR